LFVLNIIMDKHILKEGFTIFYSDYCPYCREALKILNGLRRTRGIPFRAVDFNEINGDKAAVLAYLNRNRTRFNFDPKHTTKPVILFNGTFIGGCNELQRLVGGNQRSP